MQEEGLPTFPLFSPRIPSGCKASRESSSGFRPSCQVEDAHTRIETFQSPFTTAAKSPCRSSCPYDCSEFASWLINSVAPAVDSSLV